MVDHIDANQSVENTLRRDRPSRGEVISVRGSVVDARFNGHPPLLYNLLHAGENGRTMVEVITHLDDRTVRGIALTSTQGLAQGSVIIDTGHQLRVPVGKGLLGRVFNVFGEAIDRKNAVAAGEWRSIHQVPVPLNQRARPTAMSVRKTRTKP